MHGEQSPLLWLQARDETRMQDVVVDDQPYDLSN
jgi:hypothetical protein